MAIIDKRGFIFGKINLIDFLVILFIVCLTPMFWFGYKIFHTLTPPSPQINWEEKYNEEIFQKEKVFKQYPRLRKYFK